MNNIDYIILTIIYISITTTAGFLLKNYLPSYFNQKGKNFADKEDIQELTLKVEEVKISFSKEIESLKGKIQFAQNVELQHRKSESEVIIDFYNKYFEWQYFIMSHDLAVQNKSPSEYLEQTFKQLSFHYTSTGQQLELLKLLVINQDIINLAVEMFTNLIKIDNWAKFELLKLENLKSKNDEKTRAILNIDIKGFFSQSEVDRIASLQTENIKTQDEVKELISNYHCELTKKISEIVNVHGKFCATIKEYLISKSNSF